MELLSDQVVIQRLRRYFVFGVVVMVFSLAAISMAFAFRQQLQSITVAQPPSRDSQVVTIENIFGREWEVLRGEWRVSSKDTLHLSEGTLLITSQPAASFLFESIFWLDGAEIGRGESPGLVFAYQDPESTYQLQFQAANMLKLEKRNGGEWSSLVWVKVKELPDPLRILIIKMQGGRILAWLNDELVIDYTDPDPLSGEGFGVAVGSTPIFWTIDRIDAVDSK